MARVAEGHRARASRIAAVVEWAIRVVVAALRRQLHGIEQDLRAQAPRWRDDPAVAMRGRRAIAARLKKVRPGVAAGIREVLHDAVEAGAPGSGVDPREDELVARVLREADVRVRVKAAAVARQVTTAPLKTDAQVRHMAERVLAVESPAEASASVAVVRAADLASAGAAAGEPRVWIPRPDACVHCQAFAGARAVPPRQVFLPMWQVADHPLPWASAGVHGPPLHDHCRCTTYPWTRGLADALRKNASAVVAKGTAGYLSRPAKARAADRLLRTRAPLNPAARRAAAKLARSGPDTQEGARGRR